MNTQTPGTPPNGARWLTQALEIEGVQTLFGYPGGTIMPFYDALVDSSLKHILVRHEQGAALAAFVEQWDDERAVRADLGV